MTLAQLAITVALLGGLGLIATPNEPKVLSLIRPSDVTTFVAEIGIIFLLFFLGLEFTLGRLARSRRHVLLGGAIDFMANATFGLIVGLAVFGFSFGAVILAAAIYVSSSAITVKGLIDFRRLADDETDLVLAVLVAEDLVIALVLGFAAGGGGALRSTLEVVAKAIAFIAIALGASKWLHQAVDRFLGWLPREFFLLAVFAFVIGAGALAKELGLSEAIGALMAGVVLSETSAREEIEERFFSFRDIFAALFFFVFGLSIDVGAAGGVAWLLVAAVAVTLLGKIGAGYTAGLVGGFNRRQSLNAGIALVAHGEFTIILAQVAKANTRVADATQAKLVAFAGLYVLITSTLGVILMKESKALGRRLFPVPKLRAGG